MMDAQKNRTAAESGRTSRHADEERLALPAHEQALLSAIPDIVMEVDARKVYTWANRPGIEFFGGDVIGKEAGFYFEGEQPTYDVVQPLFTGNEDVIYVESWQRRRDGEKRLLNWWCRVLKDDEGNVTGAISTARDVTESRRAEEALKESETLFRSYTENAPIGFFICNEYGRYLEVNKAAEMITGYSREELLSMSIPDILPDESKPIAGQQFQMVAATGRTSSEFAFRHKDGHIGIWSLEGVRLSPNRFIGFVSDITERKQAEKQLAETKALLNAAFEQSPVPMALASVPDYVFRIVNTAAADFLGIRASDYLSKPLSEINITWHEFTPEGKPIAIPELPMPRALGGQMTKDMEMRVKRSDGAEKWESCSGVPVFDDDGKLLAGMIVFQDITERKRAEEALRASEEKHRRLIKNSHDIIYTLSADGVFTFVSPAWTALLGHPVSHAVGQSFQQFVHTDDIPACLKWLQKVIETGQRQEGIEYRVRHINGSWLWHTSSAVPTKNEAGSIIGFEGIARDITDQKQASLQNARSFSLMEAILGSTDNGILVVDDNGKIVRTNSRFFELWSIPADLQSSGNDSALLGFVLDQLADPNQFISKVKELYSNPESESYEILEFKNGGFFERSSRPMLLDGRMIGRVWSFRDITERKKAEQEIQESEQKFRTLFENMTEGVALHTMIYDENGADKDYQIADINPAYHKHTGLDPDMARGQAASVLYRSDVPPYLREFGTVARTGKPFSFETYFKPLEKHFRISVISPKRGFFATVFEDITDRILREKELRQKNEELERFTYTVSHDLKSPLITIKGFSGGLLRDVAAGKFDRIESDLKRISDAAGKMGGLLEDVLELSRIGRVINTPSDLNFGDLVHDAVALLAGSIAERKAAVKVQEKMPVVHGDKKRLAEVLQNLIENSLKFLGGQTDPVIEIGAMKRDGEQVFFVKDNGIGIDPRYHATVFGLFNKLDASSSGTGIGLALVQRIIDFHGGRIWVESVGKNCGTAMCFTLKEKKI